MWDDEIDPEILPDLVYSWIRRKKLEAAMIWAEIGQHVKPGTNTGTRPKKPTQAKTAGNQKVVGASGKVYSVVPAGMFLNPASMIKKKG